jgi:hypothetical protein
MAYVIEGPQLAPDDGVSWYLRPFLWIGSIGASLFAALGIDLPGFARSLHGMALLGLALAIGVAAVVAGWR